VKIKNWKNNEVNNLLMERWGYSRPNTETNPLLEGKASWWTQFQKMRRRSAAAKARKKADAAAAKTRKDRDSAELEDLRAEEARIEAEEAADLARDLDREAVHSGRATMRYDKEGNIVAHYWKGAQGQRARLELERARRGMSKQLGELAESGTLNEDTLRVLADAMDDELIDWAIEYERMQGISDIGPEAMDHMLKNRPSLDIDDVGAWRKGPNVSPGAAEQADAGLNINVYVDGIASTKPKGTSWLKWLLIGGTGIGLLWGGAKVVGMMTDPVCPEGTIEDETGACAEIVPPDPKAAQVGDQFPPREEDPGAATTDPKCASGYSFNIESGKCENLEVSTTKEKGPAPKSKKETHTTPASELEKMRKRKGAAENEQKERVEKVIREELLRFFSKR